MVVASLTFTVGTLLSFVMANAVVAARGLLLPYTYNKKQSAEERKTYSEETCAEEQKQWECEEQYLITTS